MCVCFRVSALLLLGRARVFPVLWVERYGNLYGERTFWCESAKATKSYNATFAVGCRSSFRASLTARAVPHFLPDHDRVRRSRALPCTPSPSVRAPKLLESAMPRRCLEHGLDQLKRPSSTYSFGAMELAIFVAVQLHAPASRARPDPAGMAHKECTMLTASRMELLRSSVPFQPRSGGASERNNTPL